MLSALFCFRQENNVFVSVCIFEQLVNSVFILYTVYTVYTGLYNTGQHWYCSFSDWTDKFYRFSWQHCHWHCSRYMMYAWNHRPKKVSWNRRDEWEFKNKQKIQLYGLRSEPTAAESQKESILSTNPQSSTPRSSLFKTAAVLTASQILWYTFLLPLSPSW